MLTKQERDALAALLTEPCHVEISWPTPAGSYERKKLNRSEVKELADALRARPQ